MKYVSLQYILARTNESEKADEKLALRVKITHMHRNQCDKIFKFFK